MKRKILFVVDENKTGGVSSLLTNILNNINIKDIDITLLILNNIGQGIDNINERVNIIYGNKYFNVIGKSFKELINENNFKGAFKKIKISLDIKTGRIVNKLKKQRKEMKLPKYDIEIAFKSGFCSIFTASGDSKYKINWVHEDYSTYNMTKRYEKTFKNIFNIFDKHIIVSADAKVAFNNIYGLENKSIVIENYIDTNLLISKANEKCNYTMNKNKLNIVTLGRFCYEKGFDRLIKVADMLNKDNLLGDITIYVIGYGALENELKQMVINYNLQNKVFILNSQKDLNNNPYTFMKTADLFIMPSRTESFGMVRVEALTLGLPVLTTNVASTLQTITSDIGIICNNTTNDMYVALRKTLSDRKIIDKLKTNVKKYSYDKNNKIILEKIQNILEENFETR